jgi:Xaa-Pro dipeptidase
MTDGIAPITDAERRSRIEKARRLMRESNLGALVSEGGSSTHYFTGARPAPGAPLSLWLLPARREPLWVAPAAAPQALRDHGAATGNIGIEERVRFSIVDGLRRQLPQAQFVSGTPVTAGCRMIKSPAEIALP